MNFNNTEIAFSPLSDKELKKAHFVFNILNNNKLSKFGKAFTMKAFEIGLPIKGLVKSTVFDAFVGGENLVESEAEIKMLSNHGIGVILDYGIEAKNEEDQLDAFTANILALLEEIEQKDQKDIDVSVKISAFASNPLLEKMSSNEVISDEEMDLWQKVIDRVDDVCKKGQEANIKIYIDAEESWYQPAIDDVVEVMMEKYNKVNPIVFHTIQLYRVDRLAYLKTLHNRAKEKEYILAVKLVRGAYMEKERERAFERAYPSPIQVSKEATDRDYNKALSYCVDNLDSICMCIATHNEESNYFLEELLNAKHISKNNPHIIGAQLFGMGDHITFNMAEENYNAMKYLPYGPVEELLPYLLRRAQENSSVDGQASRELGLLNKELERRNLKTIF